MMVLQRLKIVNGIPLSISNKWNETYIFFQNENVISKTST